MYFNFFEIETDMNEISQIEYWESQKVNFRRKLEFSKYEEKSKVESKLNSNSEVSSLL